MRSVFIEARQWHDRTYGNTYYSARVFIDGQELYTTGMRYGYEYQYEHDVTHDLITRELLPGESSREGIRRWCRDNGVDFYSVRYDAKKSELWKAGE
jgi:hypothetical protein